MISFTVTLNPAVIGATSALLLIFSFAFNLWITAHEERNGYTTGNTAWLVVVGVVVTLVGVALVSWQAALIAVVGFIFSGPAMIWGEHNRELNRVRRCAERQAKAEAERIEREQREALEKTRDR